MSQLAKQQLSQSLVAALRRAFANRPADGPQQGKPLGLLDWGQQYLPAHFARPPSSMHRWLANGLDGLADERGKKLNLIGPRGSAKSTVATLAFVLRSAVEGIEPYLWILSDTESQARTHLENVKTELTDNAILASAYPSAVGRGPRWRSNSIELRNSVVIEAFGAGQKLRGRRRREHRPSVIVCDDLQNESHIASPARRLASRDWFHGVVLKAGTPDTCVINLATALHRDALALELHRTPGWESRSFASVLHWPKATALWAEWEAIYCDSARKEPGADALAFYHENLAAMQAGARVLWPEQEDLYELMCMRVQSGVAAFEREKQGSPVDPSRCEWPESYFGEHAWFEDWPQETKLRVIAIDPSKGADARHGDYSAIVSLAVDQAGVLYVDADIARRPTPQMVADGVSRYLAFQPDAFGVEANQYQQLLAGEFVAEFHRQRVMGVQPCEIHNHTNKAMRIRRLGPYLSQRRLRFRRGSESAALLVDQLRDFPLGAHDDGPDALEMALRLAEQVWQGQTQSDGLGDRLPVG